MSIPMMDIKLSTNRGLWGHVRPNLRAVYVHNIDYILYVRFFFDGQLEEFDEELVEDIMTEVISDFCHDDRVEFDYRFTRLDYPQPFPEFGECVYLRYEPPVP